MTTKSQIPKRAPGGTRPPGGLSRSAFSLVELLAVIAIIAAMMALVVPATKGLLGSSGRKGAVNQLLNTFEQARVAALESGAPVYILLWRRDYPEKDAYMVIRKGTEADLIGASTTPPDFVYLTGWKTLPRGILFYEPTSDTGQSSSVLSKPDDPLPAGISEADLALFPMKPSKNNLSFIKFNESGIIQFPSSGTQLALYIAEGTRSTTENLTHTQGTLTYTDGSYVENDDGSLTGTTYELQGGLEKLAFARFTGRARLEISTFN